MCTRHLTENEGDILEMIFIYLPKLNNRFLPMGRGKEKDRGTEQRRKKEREGLRERRGSMCVGGRKLNRRMEHSKVLSLANSANKNTEFIYISNQQKSFSVSCYMQ